MNFKPNSWVWKGYLTLENIEAVRDVFAEILEGHVFTTVASVQHKDHQNESWGDPQIEVHTTCWIDDARDRGLPGKIGEVEHYDRGGPTHSANFILHYLGSRGGWTHTFSTILTEAEVSSGNDIPKYKRVYISIMHGYIRVIQYSGNENKIQWHFVRQEPVPEWAREVKE